MIFHYDCHKILIINDQDNVSHVHIFEIEIYKYLHKLYQIQHIFEIISTSIKFVSNELSSIEFL